MPHPKKSGLAMMLAIGPKSKNMDGASDSSISAPDQSGDMMAPGGDMPPADDAGAMPAEPQSNAIMLPKGFKAPDGSEEGQPFTTTVRGKIMNGEFVVDALGNVPLHSEGGETPDAEASESPQEEAAEPEEQSPEDAAMASNMMKKKAGEMAAKKVFQPGR